MIIHGNFYKTKNKTLPTCLQGNYQHSLGEFSNTSYGLYGAERVLVSISTKIRVKVKFQDQVFRDLFSKLTYLSAGPVGLTHTCPCEIELTRSKFKLIFLHPKFIFLSICAVFIIQDN